MRLWSVVLLSIALAFSLALPGEVASAAPENPESQPEVPPKNSKRPDQPPGKDDKGPPEANRPTTTTTVAPTTTTTIAATTTTTASSTTTTTAATASNKLDETIVQTEEEDRAQTTEDEPAATVAGQPPKGPNQPDQPGSATLRPQVVELSNRGLDIPQAAPVREPSPSEEAQPTPLEGLMVAFATTTETTALYWKVALALGLLMSTLFLIGFSRLGDGQSELRREVMPLRNPVSRLSRS